MKWTKGVRGLLTVGMQAYRRELQRQLSDVDGMLKQLAIDDRALATEADLKRAWRARLGPKASRRLKKGAAWRERSQAHDRSRVLRVLRKAPAGLTGAEMYLALRPMSKYRQRAILATLVKSGAMRAAGQTTGRRYTATPKKGAR